MAMNKSKAEFARMCGVSRVAITKAAKSIFPKAIKGKYVDVSHPDAKAYLESKGGKLADITKPDSPKPKKKAPRKPAAKKPRAKSSEPKPPAPELEEPELFPIDLLPSHIREMADKPFIELLNQFGTDMAFYRWVQSYEKLENTTTKAIKNEKDLGLLVDRSLMDRVFMAPVEDCNKKLLADAPGRMARTAASMVKAGNNSSEIEIELRNVISSFLEQMKQAILRNVDSIS